MIEENFDTPGQVDLQVVNQLGEVRASTHTGKTTEVVISAPAGGDEVLQKTRVEHQVVEGRHHIFVHFPGCGGLLRSLIGVTDVLVSVTVPEGALIDVTTAAGAVTAEGRYGAARLRTASGEVSVGTVEGDLDVHTASGDVTVQSVSGQASVATASGAVHCNTLTGPSRVRTASGGVEVELARGHLSVRTASGRVTAGELDDGCQLHTASGSQRVERLTGGVAQLETVSGDLLVAVARGAIVDVDAQTTSGTLSSEIELDATGPPLTGPPLTGPAVTGPAVTGPAVTGPAVTGPPVTGPPVTGPPVTGPPVAGPPVTGQDGPQGSDGADGPHWPPLAGSRIEIRARTVSGDVRIQRASA